MLPFVLTALISVAVTILVVLLIANLTSGEKKVQYKLDHLYGVDAPEFRRSIGNLLGPPVVEGNAVTPLYNGSQIFPAMLEAIGRAKVSITFETFIYWSGRIGERFAEALAERARAGVRVHVLLDWLGAKKIDNKYVEEMERAGVEVERY